MTIRIFSTRRSGLELSGFAVQAFFSGTEAIRHINREFDEVIVSDVRMPNMDGLSFFKQVQEMDSELPVLLLTGHGDVPMAVQALKDGVYDFLVKPFSVAELIASLNRASQKRKLVIENRNLRKLHAGHINAKTAFVGEKYGDGLLRQTLSQVAEADVDVLITGESGTGKRPRQIAARPKPSKDQAVCANKLCVRLRRKFPCGGVRQRVRRKNAAQALHLKAPSRPPRKSASRNGFVRRCGLSFSAATGRAPSLR